MSDTLRSVIITSEAAERMLDRTTPIYDNSVVGLYLFEAIGREYDMLNQIIEELPDQLNPDTATWLLGHWERRYGLTTDESISLDDRRRRIRIRQKHTGAFNPYKIRQLAENITGLSARVEEHTAPYTFAVYLSSTSSDAEELRKAIRKIKPSHLSFEIGYEQGVSNEVYVGGNVDLYKNFVLPQAN